MRHQTPGFGPANAQRRRLSSALAILGGLGLAGCSRHSEPAPAPAGTPRQISINTSKGVDSAPDALASTVSGRQLDTLFSTITEKMFGFQAGKATADVGIVVLFDPQCPHCAHLWQQSQRLWHEVRFAWVPVPLMNKESMTQGAMVLGSLDPVTFMQSHEASILAGNGGAPMDAALVEKGRTKIEANHRLSLALRVDSVPLIYFRKESGEVLATKGGMGAEELVVLVQS